MKTITSEEYERLLFYKSMNDQLSRLSNRLYYFAKKSLATEDDEGWLTDYFYNDAISVTELFEHLNIDVEKP